MASIPNRYVVRGDAGGWDVVKDGHVRASAHLKRKSDAVRRAKTLTRQAGGGEVVVLGRSGRGWAVPWDAQVSRHHARLRWNGYRLEVRRDPDARNPVYLRGQEVAQFELQPGEHFVIGQTTFTLADQRVTLTTAAPKTISIGESRK